MDRWTDGQTDVIISPTIFSKKRGDNKEKKGGMGVGAGGGGDVPSVSSAINCLHFSCFLICLC